jgi:RNA polymerase sigma factor (sigma-70 family)
MKDKWEDFLNGNNCALADLYDELFLPLLFVSIKYTKDKDLSRDIISDIFLSLIETTVELRIEKWKAVREIKSFLIIIVRNKSIDAIRMISNRKQIDKVLTIQQIEYCEQEFLQIDHFDKIISLLNESEKELFELHFDGYSNFEISEQMNYSEKTVRNKLSISRKKLIYFWKNLIILMLWKILN